MCSQLYDYEKQHLMEMFPTCPQNILNEASKRSTIDLACDYVMDFWSGSEGLYLMLLFIFFQK